MRTLVVGCDASGKSTLLENIHATYNDPLIESTSTPESRAFKHAHLDHPVDEEFIDQREQLYLGLTQTTLNEINERQVECFIGTDATLVTRLSHAVMRRCINSGEVDPEQIIRQWVDNEIDTGVGLPDVITLTHAPFPLVRSRINTRQQQGDKDEKFWGFNSPYFLDSYQEAWKGMMPYLAEAGFRCITFNTAHETPAQMMQRYGEIREHIKDAPAIRLPKAS